MPYRKLNLTEAAAYLHIPEEDVQALAKRNEIPVERHGERLLFIKRELDAWASQRILGLSAKRLEGYHRRTSAQAHDLSQRHTIIGELIRPDGIEVALRSATRPSVLRDMVAQAERTGLLTATAAELLDALKEREALCSTALPGGLALLHPRNHDPYMFSDSFLVFGKTARTVPFGALDGLGTDLFFLVCCQDDRIHLHVLARLCMMCSQTPLLPNLRSAAARDEMLAALLAAEQAVIREL